MRIRRSALFSLITFLLIRFVTFNVPAMYVAIQAVLSLFASRHTFGHCDGHLGCAYETSRLAHESSSESQGLLWALMLNFRDFQRARHVSLRDARPGIDLDMRSGLHPRSIPTCSLKLFGTPKLTETA